MKDGTAMGVAKVRHYESLHEPSKRLYHDPYATSMYPGGFVQAWLGEGGTRWLYDALGVGGILNMLSIRTKWIDDEITGASASMEQLVILGAGYDTRGFRLDLNDSMQVFEVDQPDVQAKKLKKLEHLSKSDGHVASRMTSGAVKFVAVDFNEGESINDKLSNTEGYCATKPTVATMEGVTQYIPKTSTADTLTKLISIMPAGSKLLISYVDENVFEDPAQCGPPDAVKKVVSMVSGMMGEKWISSWTPQGFQTFLEDLGFHVVSDTTTRDYREKYMVPLGREVDEREMWALERFVVATVQHDLNGPANSSPGAKKKDLFGF